MWPPMALPLAKTRLQILQVRRLDSMENVDFLGKQTGFDWGRGRGASRVWEESLKGSR